MRLPPSFAFAGVLLVLVSTCLVFPTARAAGLEFQPFAAQVRRIIEATDHLGEPFSDQEKEELARLTGRTEDPEAIEQMQQILDRRCLLVININPEMRVKCAQGAASPELSEQGWRQFLVKVVNEAGTTAPLRIESVNAQPVSNAESVNPRRRARRGEGAPVAPKEISELGRPVLVPKRARNRTSRNAGRNRCLRACEGNVQAAA